MKDNLRIALTFSGGGYRAATFHLGALSYLHSVKVGEFTLLDHVVALSTISGGTITGLRYMLGLSRGESVTDIFKELYTFLTDVELATVAMNNLASYEKGQCASLIRTMADIYNKELFKGAVLGDLMDQLDDIHICHFAANATDFTNGLAFRFQVTEKTGAKQEQATGYGLIGNNKIRIPREVARHIRLSEVLACSSCFPSGFEPLVFPKDFVLGDSEEVKKFIAKTEPFGIMDGGIVDNQGIEPILLAEQRMETSLGCKDGKCLDLIIVSDVASPYMSAYQPSDVHLPKGLNRMTLKKLTASIWGVGIGLTVATALSLVFTSTSFLSGVLVAVLVLVAGILIIYTVMKKKLISMAAKSVIQDSIPAVMNLRFGDIATLLANRVSSVLLLVSSVFMKHLRRMDYRSIYRDDDWKNRCMMNGVYELRPDEAWASKLKSGQLPEYLKPSNKIQQHSTIATAMGTTLWFTQEEKEAGVHDSLIAAGQYTICWNLLEYIETIKKDPSNTNEHHQLILACEEQLRKDWEKFQKDPLCGLAEWKNE